MIIISITSTAYIKSFNFQYKNYFLCLLCFFLLFKPLSPLVLFIDTRLKKYSFLVNWMEKKFSKENIDIKLLNCSSSCLSTSSHTLKKDNKISKWKPFKKNVPVEHKNNEIEKCCILSVNFSWWKKFYFLTFH